LVWVRAKGNGENGDQDPALDVSLLLSSLQRKEFLLRTTAFPEVEYLFKHALTQEVAYNSVLIERRKPSMNRTAQVIEQLYQRPFRRGTTTSCASFRAEACFSKPSDIARQQQAKSWELRATVSLARLWQQQGKRAEAHQMVSGHYNWFTEGFDKRGICKKAKGTH